MSGFRIAGGVLTIVASCFCLLWGLLGIWICIENSFPEAILLFGIPGILGFTFGLTAGILAFKRMLFALVIAGEFIVFGAALLALIPLKEYDGLTLQNVYKFWPFALPALTLILPAVIFTFIGAKNYLELSQPRRPGAVSFCRKCGAKLDPNAKFCQECGEKI